MSVISCVAASAQLNISGSVAKRSEIALQKREAFLREINESLGNDRIIFHSKIVETIKKHAPDIDFSLGRVPFRQSENTRGSVGPKIVDCSVRGFNIYLPFSPESPRFLPVAQENQKTFVHEMTHFFDLISLPKFSARDCSLAKREKDPLFLKREEKYKSFYDAKLYSCEYESGFLGFCCGLFVNQNPKEKAFCKNPQAKAPQRMKNLKKELGKLLKKASSNEKIDVLQDFRNSLRLEQNARKTEMDFEKTSQDKNKKAEYIHNYYFYENKIALIEELLREEIASHRKAHAKTLKK